MRAKSNLETWKRETLDAMNKYSIFVFSSSHLTFNINMLHVAINIPYYFEGMSKNTKKSTIVITLRQLYRQQKHKNLHCAVAISSCILDLEARASFFFISYSRYIANLFNLFSVKSSVIWAEDNWSKMISQN